MLNPKVLVLLIAVISSGPVGSRAQSLYQTRLCTGLLEKRTDALRNQHWQMLVDYARQYMSLCSDISTKKGQATALDEIGLGLSRMGQYEDAIPVLRRCVAMKTDYAGCWVGLGIANYGLHRIAEAKESFKKAIQTGAFDEVSAVEIRTAKVWLSQLEKDFPDDPERSSEANGDSPTRRSFGTGFFVSSDGQILTNDHVVAGCRIIRQRDGKALQIVSRNVKADLALLKADTIPAGVAVFRAGPPPKPGDTVIAFGFPLPGLLSSEGNISTGVISATTGLGDDVRFVQISTPIQPGNSGGPLFDSSGHIIGVVVAKLDALRIARATGDIPQNVNFAVHWSEVRSFLDGEGIHYRTAPSLRPLGVRDIAAIAGRVSVGIDCGE